MNEVTVEVEEVETEVSQFSVEEAKELTTKIRTAETTIRTLLLSAFEGRIHRALGYPNFNTYAEKECGLQPRTTEIHLAQARVERELTELAGCDIEIPQRVARGVTMEDLEKLKTEVESALEGAPDSKPETLGAVALAATRRFVDDKPKSPMKEKEVKVPVGLTSILRVIDGFTPEQLAATFTGSYEEAVAEAHRIAQFLADFGAAVQKEIENRPAHKTGQCWDCGKEGLIFDGICVDVENCG